MTPTADRTFAYVANTASDNVSVIRTSDNVVVATIAVGDGPHGVAISPSAGRVYVANGLSNSVSVIRTSDNTVAATIPVGHNPQDVVVAPDGARVYVTNSSDATVSVIRTSDNVVVATILTYTPAPALREPIAGAIAIAPDGLHIYVTTTAIVFDLPIGGTTAIRTSDYTVLGGVSPGLGQFPADVAVTPDGSRAYVASAGFPGSVSVIQTSTFASIPGFYPGGSASPGAVAITPDGAFAYVVRKRDILECGALWAIRTSDNTSAATVPNICGATQVAITPNGAYAYVTNLVTGGPGNVVVVRTSDNTIAGSTTVGTSPDGVAIAFVPSPSQQVVALQDLLSSADIVSGVKSSLAVKLNSASTALQGGKTRSACGSLQDFASQVMAQAGKKISTADAALLSNSANQVRDVIGC